MVLIGLLLLALALLVVGLVTGGAPWLAGSLVASVVAGYLLWKEREKLAARSGTDKNEAAPKTSAPAGAAQAAPAPARRSASSPDRSGQVWVVDTMPQFHAEKCAAIQNLDAEPIPLAQAVGDGFTECTVCTPAAHLTGAQVWVVDGRPDYHLDDCRSLKIAAAQQSRDPEQIPHGQAVDDGFSACPDCRPEAVATADTEPDTEPDPEPRTGPDSTADSRPSPRSETVWVVDGRPRYHLSDCLIIKDQSAEEIPFAQAEEDGFMPCSMCEPSLLRRA